MNFKSSRKIADICNKSLIDSPISLWTVRRVTRAVGIYSYEGIIKTFLSKKDKRRRLKWCLNRQYCTFREWSRVIFSDESNFEVFNRKSTVHVKRERSQKYDSRFVIPRLQGGGGSAGIWGCISGKGTGVANLYTGRINKISYIETIENCLLPSIELLSDDCPFIYMQDGAPAHTAKESLA